MNLTAAEFQLWQATLLPNESQRLVEEARFDRVFLRPLALGAKGTADESLNVKNVMELIAAQFETNGNGVKVVFKIIVFQHRVVMRNSIFASRQ